MSINSSMLSSWRHRSQWKHRIASTTLRKTPPHHLHHGPCLLCFGFVSKVKMRKTGKNCAMEKMNAAFLKKKPTKRPLGVWREQLHQSSRKVLTETQLLLPSEPSPGHKRKGEGQEQKNEQQGWGKQQHHKGKWNEKILPLIRLPCQRTETRELRDFGLLDKGEL